MLGRLKQALTQTRRQMTERVENLFLGKKAVDGEILDRLEEALLATDLGLGTTQQLLEELRDGLDRQELKDLNALKRHLKRFMADHLGDGKGGLDPGSTKPFTIMVVGVNGVGKTTTIAKLAHRFQKDGRSVLLAAGDTFRAAAVEQLEQWGNRLGVSVIKHQSGADPSAVLFDAVTAARNRGIDILLADTAGRLHTKVNLMEEIKKMKRVMGKALPGSPREILLVVDATLGQNALIQARQFHEAVGVTGVVLTKLDGTAKGGIAVSIASELGLPIRFVGVGEGVEDLEVFSAEVFAESLID